jgi:hypothetical protein
MLGVKRQTPRRLVDSLLRDWQPSKASFALLSRVSRPRSIRGCSQDLNSSIRHTLVPRWLVIDRLVGWLVGWLVIDRLVGWLVGWLLIGWLVGGLVGY